MRHDDLSWFGDGGRRAPRLFVIHPYGVYSPERETVENEGYNDYLNQVARWLRYEVSEDDWILTPGGQKGQNGELETDNLHDQLRERLANLKLSLEYVSFIKDPRPTTTLGIVASGLCYAKVHEARQITAHEPILIVHVCDRLRMPKTLLACLLSRNFLEVKSFKRVDTHPHSKWYLQLAAAFKMLWTLRKTRRELQKYS